jgi:hypothetical protein
MAQQYNLTVTNPSGVTVDDLGGTFFPVGGPYVLTDNFKEEIIIQSVGYGSLKALFIAGDISMTDVHGASIDENSTDGPGGTTSGAPGGGSGNMNTTTYDPTNVNSDAFNADNHVFDPDGDIAATNVQAAIVEVRDDTDTKLGTKVDNSEKGAANGVATLDAGGKVPTGQLPIQMMEFEGNWNASTNTPTLANADVDKQGTTYRVNVAGSVDFGAGSITFQIGDWVYNTGTVWEKGDNIDQVTSVAGKTGAVNLVASDVGLGNVTNDAQLKRAANDLNTFTEKTTPVGTDIAIIEDSADAFNKKKMPLNKIPLTSDEVKTSTATSTTSVTDVPIDSMTLTPGAGTYLFWFDSSADASNNQSVFYSFYIDDGVTPVQVADTEKFFDAPATGVREGIHLQGKVTLAAGEALEVWWRVTGGTVNANQRSLMYLKV